MLLTGLPPDSVTVDRDRLYWTSDTTTFVNSVDKFTGLDVASHVAGSANNLIAFADYLQPFPGKHSLRLLSCVLWLISVKNDVFLNFHF